MKDKTVITIQTRIKTNIGIFVANLSIEKSKRFVKKSGTYFTIKIVAIATNTGK